MFIHEESLDYPLHESDIREQHPQVLWPASGWTPETVKPFGYAPVRLSEKPEAAFGKLIVEGKPRKTKGGWVQVWKAINSPTILQDTAALKKRILEDSYQDSLKVGLKFGLDSSTTIRVQIQREADIANINMVAAAGLSASMRKVEVELYFRDADNAVHLLNSQQAIDLGDAANARRTTLARFYWSLKDAIQAAILAEDLDALNSIEPDQGWPFRPASN